MKGIYANHSKGNHLLYTGGGWLIDVYINGREGFDLIGSNTTLSSTSNVKGPLREFVNDIWPNDDITFEYIKRASKEQAPVLIGSYWPNKHDYTRLG